MDQLFPTNFNQAAQVIDLPVGAAVDFDNIVAELKDFETESGHPLPHGAGFIAMHELMGNVVDLETGEVFTPFL